MKIEILGIGIFIILLLILLYLNRKKIVNQKILFPFVYILMIRTKLGLRLMDIFAKKYSKQLKYLGYLGIIIGFIGMIVISFSLMQNIYNLVTKPKTSPGVGIVLPIEAKGVFYVPFFYWITAIFIILVVHEFSHGIFIRMYKVKIKSSGFAVLSLLAPIIPAAFVEPDEKKLIKKPAKEQLSIYSAGPFSNIVLGLLILLLSSIVVSPLLSKIIEFNGVVVTGIIESNSTIYPAEKAGITNGQLIKEINKKKILTTTNFTNALLSKKPGDKIEIKTTNATYQVILAEHPEEKGKPYLGVYVSQSKLINEDFVRKYGKVIPALLLWLVGLLYWLYVLNLGIGLFNLVPIGPIDGGRMLRVALDSIFKKEKADKLFNGIGMFFLIIIITNIVFAFIK